MSQLQVTARLKIKEGKLNEFKELAVQCLASTKEKDPGTLQYDWFFSEDQLECVVREIYADSNSVFAHLANLGDLFGKILQTADMSLEVYGEPSEELRKATEGMNPTIYPFYQGL
jgi:quinol monooxygenase YgiN